MTTTMTTTMQAEHGVMALDPILAALEPTPCPVLARAATEARDALLRLLDVLVLVEPGAATRVTGN